MATKTITMELGSLLLVLLVLVLVLIIIGAVRRVSLWRQGQALGVDFFRGLLSIPRRYLVDLHHVVGRDKYISNTHVATAGGFVASVILIVLQLVLQFLLGVDSLILQGSLLLTTAIMFCGALFVAKRRIKPAVNLSRGPWMRLPISLLAFSSSFFVITLLGSDFTPEGIGSWLLLMVLLIGVTLGVGELFFGMTWGGPMKHAFAGALHLAFHRRADRFGGGQSTGLKPLDLTELTLGVAKAADFKWNQLLGFDACVQCGRCEKVCPAFASGQPLNPKKLIQDMVVGMAGGTTESYAGSPHPRKAELFTEGGTHKPIFQGLLDPDTLWACTTCRACVEECPMMIEHVDAVVDMRRHLTLERGETPGKGAEVLENLIMTDNPNGMPPQQRNNWAVDQQLPLMQTVKQADVLFWIGDGAFDMRNQRTLKAVVTLLRRAKVDFAVLGNEEVDCGDLARRLGDEATFQRLAKTNINTLKKYHFKRIVTADPHSFHVLKNEYGDFGGQFEVLHHTQLFAELVANGELVLQALVSQTVTYHDPCYLGRYNQGYEAPRFLLRQMGIEVREMERSGFRSRCCGGGGGAPITDVPGEQRIPDMRMQDIKETQADVVAVACPQCSLMLEGVVEPRPQVKDIAEILLEALPDESMTDTVWSVPIKATKSKTIVGMANINPLAVQLENHAGGGK